MSALSAVISRGTRANEPAATSVPIGSLYFVTDENKIERSNGTTWDSYSSTHTPVQIVVTETGAVATGTTTTPFNDTIPTITAGTEFMTATITPTNSNNTLVIDVVAVVSASTSPLQIIVALHQDAVTNALAAVSTYEGVSTAVLTISFRHKMTAGTTSATTFRVRIGPSSAATVTFNGQSGGRIFGGVMASSITITELAA